MTCGKAKIKSPIILFPVLYVNNLFTTNLVQELRDSYNLANNTERLAFVLRQNTVTVSTLFVRLQG